jgi:hypothetical protein
VNDANKASTHTVRLTDKELSVITELRHQITPSPRNMGRGEWNTYNGKNLLPRLLRNVADKGVDLAFMTINHRVDSVTSSLM